MPAFSIGSYANAGRGLGDFDFVRRIEILKGPASATYGSAAIGGIVAMTTFDPADLLATAPRDLAARARLQYDSSNHSRHASLLTAGSLGGDAEHGGPEWLAGWLHREAAETQNEWRNRDANPQSVRDDAGIAKFVLAQWDEPLRLTLSGRRRHRAAR